MDFVDARELQEGVQQQVGGHLGVVDVGMQAEGLVREGGGVVFCAADVGMNGLWMVEVKILRRVVMAAVGHKL